MIKSSLVLDSLRMLICYLCIASAVFLIGCAQSTRPVVTETEYALGTTCTIKSYDKPRSGTIERAFRRVREIERKMSFVDEESEVSSVNRNAGIRPVTVSRDTFYVITKALEYAELTLGTFDITVGAVTALWGIGTGNARVPDSGEIEDMLPLVDYRFVKLDPEDRSVFLVKEGMKIDLGGIAKGYAADRAVEIMKEGGVERAILDFGGNIYVMGSKTEDTPWKVGVQNPEGTRGSYIGILEARETAVVSSGDYERFIEREGVRYHHIIDTETGYPVRNNISGCTIVADNSLKADALTTAVFSMGINEGLAFLAGIHRVGGLIVTDNREIALSADIKPAFTRTDSDFSIRESLRETERKESTQR